MSPVCLVQKKDEVWRKTVHYHKLNQVVTLITTTLSNVLSFLEQINTSSGIQLRHYWSGKGFLLCTSAGRSLAANGNDVLSLWQSQIRELQCNCWGFWVKHALFDRQFLFWEMALGASLDPSTGLVTERSSSGAAWAACHEQEAAECTGPQWARLASLQNRVKYIHEIVVSEARRRKNLVGSWLSFLVAPPPASLLTLLDPHVQSLVVLPHDHLLINTHSLGLVLRWFCKAHWHNPKMECCYIFTLVFRGSLEK